MIALVTLAEERLARNRKAVFVTAQLPQAVAPIGAVAPVLRGACSRKDANNEGAWRRLILDFRTGPGIMAGDEVKATIEESFKLAEALGLNGTPSYVVGTDVVIGAVGANTLKEKINSARCGKATC